MRPHKVFARDENDIEVEVPITFDEAVLGAKVEVPTLSGKVSMGIPRGATSGQRLRLKGRGIKPAKGEAGDQYVRLKIVTPPKIDAEMEDIARRWRDLGAPDPRASLWREL
ncbi:DnaJ C-terminal domain-containing protein [Dinoroseobacter shibae]|uniref:DnaJ C-terminal domain-containing protein n=1 Tax=Dinoroseobacter shibae TaxID=215813 RepID=UPI0000E93F26